MVEQSFSARLRNLVDDYYNRELSFEDYRAQRKRIFDDIDEQFNGIIVKTSDMKDQIPSADSEKHDSDSMKTITFSNAEINKIDR